MSRKGKMMYFSNKNFQSRFLKKFRKWPLQLNNGIFSFLFFLIFINFLLFQFKPLKLVVEKKLRLL